MITGPPSPRPPPARRLLRTTALAAALLAVVLCSSGCLTLMLWDGFAWSETYTMEVEAPAPGEPPAFEVWTETYYMDGAIRVFLTPVTLTLDLMTFYVWIWLESRSC